MKKFTLLVIWAAVFAAAACSGNKNTKDQQDPVIAKEKKKNERLAKQSSSNMLRSGKIPTVDFDFDSFRLAESAYPTLDKIAAFMVPAPSIKLIVEGHTDEIGSDEYNDWLGAARAMTVKNYLGSRGVHPDSITVYSYGKRRPLTRDNSPEGRATNRRIEFTVTGRPWDMVY